MLQCHGRRTDSRYIQRILLALLLGCAFGAFPGAARSEENTYSAYFADEPSAEKGEKSTEQGDRSAEPGGPCCCDGGCCDSFCDECECCDWAWDSPRLLGVFLASDHCFDDFISPLSNPFYFEDPRSLTEVRGIFLNNSLPRQYHAAATRRCIPRSSAVGSPTGSASSLPTWDISRSTRPRTAAAPVGFASAPIGVKYNFVRNVETQFLLTGGITYFIPGNMANFHQPADGDAHIFLTGGKQIFDRGHWISGTGFRIPLDSNWGTQFWYWSNQWDYEIVDRWFPLVGVNWWHFMRSSGVGGGSPVTGLDLINIPNGNVAGTNVASGVVGVRWKATDQFVVGTGYEFPLTTRKDILQDRFYVDVIFRY